MPRLEDESKLEVTPSVNLVRKEEQTITVSIRPRVKLSAEEHFLGSHRLSVAARVDPDSRVILNSSKVSCFNIGYYS